MKSLTVFTPTYNRRRTLSRTFESLCSQTCQEFDWLVIDDGSSDGTREWIESLGQKVQMTGRCFDWMGRIQDGEDTNHFVIQAPKMRIEYVYKPNGGLYTGYNVAYQTIQTELCVCIDSDDYMPNDAVNKIVLYWKKYYPNNSLINKISPLTGKEYCGIQGLDFDIKTNQPIGGYFPEGLIDGCVLEHSHSGDTKQVMRTELMLAVAPQIGFKGEKNFNPVYMLINVMDRYPILFLNENLCIVEYQIGVDSMSGAIFKQYVNSPRSFAKMRIQEMGFIHNNIKGRFRSAIHYVSSCLFAKEGNWLRNSNHKMITFFAAPFGIILFYYIKFKNR